MTAYIALLRKDPGSDYGVDFPDFPGCVTAGTTLEEARRMAAEALEFHIQGMSEDGEAIPEPSLLDAVMADPHNRDAVAFVVPTGRAKFRFAHTPGPVDVPGLPAKAVRVNVTPPEVEAIGRATTNRSRFLAEAAKAKLRERG